MIVQTIPNNPAGADAPSPHFVIEQTDHARMCGQLVRHFGNSAFSTPVPFDLLVFTVEHHDQGWQEVDALCEQSASTGLPHHLTQTPLPYLIRTSQGSPDFNQARHPFCGLLSSMHTYGLFNGRYGLSDFIFIDRITPEHKHAAQAMLAGELARQERLTWQLRQDPATAGWVEEVALFENYKLLQFFDTLALYFQTSHASLRQPARFLNVPAGDGNDLTIELTPERDGSYALHPWPFDVPALEVSTDGRYLVPQLAGTDFRPIFASTPKQSQTFHLHRKAENGLSSGDPS